MRFRGIGLAAALVVAMTAPAATVMAAKKPAAAAPGGIDAKAREKGMAEAPALAAAAGLTCTIADAYYIGGNPKIGQSAYEVSCGNGIGGVIVTVKDAPKPSFYTCLESNRPQADGKPSSLACKLPGNADDKAPLVAAIATSGISCTIAKARAIGSSPTSSFFEVACQDGAGYILQTSSPIDPAPTDPAKAPKMLPCLQFEPGENLACELTTREAQLAVVDQLAAASGKACTITDKRYMLSTTKGLRYYEVACSDGKGYVFEQATNGALNRTIDCAAASFVGGGCTLTDAVAAQSEQAGLYTSLVKKAGFDCTVELYAPLPTQADLKATVDEVVELKCSNRPDGAIALFKKAGGAAILNCAAAPAIGYRCTKTDVAAALIPINRDIAAASDKPFACKAYATGGLALTTDDILVEVGCDPEGRFAMAYSRSTGKPSGARTCASMGDKCKLPITKP